MSAKRQQAVEICLKRLKLEGRVLAQQIEAMDEAALTLDLLIKVGDMVPTEKEQKEAVEHSKGGDEAVISRFGVVERFFFDLSSIYKLEQRLRVWIFKNEFAEMVQNQRDRVALLMKGLSDIQGSEAPHEVLRTVLAMGNYMNGGKRNGQALGFKLESLSRLSSTKGTDGQTTLMMYCHAHCEKVFERFLSF